VPVWGTTTNYYLDVSLGMYQSLVVGTNFNLCYLTNALFSSAAGPADCVLDLIPGYGSNLVVTVPTNAGVLMDTNGWSAAGALWSQTVTNNGWRRFKAAFSVDPRYNPPTNMSWRGMVSP
jgi:hypothetical protein